MADRPENLAYLREVIRRRTLRGALSVEVDRSGAPRWISNDVTCVVRGQEVLRVCGMQRDVTAARLSTALPPPARAQRGGKELVGALLEIQRLSREALAALARGESSDDARLNLSEAQQRAELLRKMLE
jgi:hypothetical protein